MKANAVVFTAPLRVEFKEIDCPDPTDGDIVVRVEQSWISNGTEGSYLRRLGFDEYAKGIAMLEKREAIKVLFDPWMDSKG